MDRGQEQPSLRAAATLRCCTTSTAVPPAWQTSLGWGKVPRTSLPQLTEDGCRPEPLVRLARGQGAQSHQTQSNSRKGWRMFSNKDPPHSGCAVRLSDQLSNRWNSANSVVSGKVDVRTNHWGCMASRPRQNSSFEQRVCISKVPSFRLKTVWNALKRHLRTGLTLNKVCRPLLPSPSTQISIHWLLLNIQ